MCFQFLQIDVSNDENNESIVQGTQTDEISSRLYCPKINSQAVTKRDEYDFVTPTFIFEDLPYLLSSSSNTTSNIENIGYDNTKEDMDTSSITDNTKEDVDTSSITAEIQKTKVTSEEICENIHENINQKIKSDAATQQIVPGDRGTSFLLVIYGPRVERIFKRAA